MPSSPSRSGTGAHPRPGSWRPWRCCTWCRGRTLAHLDAAVSGENVPASQRGCGRRAGLAKVDEVRAGRSRAWSRLVTCSRRGWRRSPCRARRAARGRRAGGRRGRPARRSDRRTGDRLDRGLVARAQLPRRRARLGAGSRTARGRRARAPRTTHHIEPIEERLHEPLRGRPRTRSPLRPCAWPASPRAESAAGRLREGSGRTPPPSRSWRHSRSGRRRRSRHARRGQDLELVRQDPPMAPVPASTARKVSAALEECAVGVVHDPILAPASAASTWKE